VEGGSVRGLGKVLAMRRRNKDGSAEYPDKDPLDKPGEITTFFVRLKLRESKTSDIYAYSLSSPSSPHPPSKPTPSNSFQTSTPISIPIHPLPFIES
jgi:hypothetical protein